MGVVKGGEKKADQRTSLGLKPEAARQNLLRGVLVSEMGPRQIGPDGGKHTKVDVETVRQ